MSINLQGKKYHWSFKKFVLNLLIAVFVISFWMVYVSGVTKATPETKVFEITVHRGDTLWSIAHRIAPDSDPRATIRRIKTRNNLTDTALTAGQRLEIDTAGDI